MKIGYTKYGIILLLIFIISIGSSFAYYSWGSSVNTSISFDVVADSVYIYYSGGADITGFNLYPTDNKNEGITKDIVVRSEKENKSIQFNLYLDLKTLPDALKEESFRYAIYDGTTLIKEGSMTDTTEICSTNNTNHFILLNDVITTTVETTYTLYLWIDGLNYTNPDTMMNQSFEFTLHADGDNVKTIYNTMALNAVLDNTSSEFVSSSTGIKFSQVSSDTNGKGIYKMSGTVNDVYPIYYYRGAVADNNVLFANFCWKIIRTTDTGGIKLIYNGVPNNGTCDNIGSSTHADSVAYNTQYSGLLYVGYMYGNDSHTISSKAISSIPESVFMSDVTWNGSSYSLATNASTVTISDYTTAQSNGTLNNYHYTCFTTNTSCSSIYFIKNFTTTYIFYIRLSGGELVDDVLNNSFDYNNNDSNIKTYLENWYVDNLNDYTNDYIVDVGYCNDRSIYVKNGWDPNGGNLKKFLFFGSFGRSAGNILTFSCDDTDKFSVSTNNGNGKSLYPVGLITVDEVRLAGGLDSYFYSSAENTSYYLYNAHIYWTMSPYNINQKNSLVYLVDQFGKINSNGAIDERGVRPVISLKNGTIISDGDGSVTSPYIVS